MTKEKIVLVGNGMAGVKFIEELLKINKDLFDITIFGAEPHPNYNRIQLSTVLAGDAAINDIVLNDFEWYKENGIKLHTGQLVTKIDADKREVYTESGLIQNYDKLVIATGSVPIILPIPGSDKDGVVAFREIEDCEKMIAHSKKYKKAIVIGGGLLGLEAARGLLNLSMEVSVVHLFDTLMERQLDSTAAKMLKLELENQGMRFLLEKDSKEIIGNERVQGITFKDGTTEEADLIVMAVGIRPNITLARESGLEVNRGIVVNDYLETNLPNIYALGECVEHRETVYGIVAPLFEQGQVLAKRLCNVETKPYEGSLVYTKLKVAGVDVFSAGEFIDTEELRAIRVHDEFEGIYKKALVRDNKLVGAVLFGNTSDSNRLVKMMKSGTDIASVKRVSILEDSQNNGLSGVEAVMALPDDEIICGCNGVTKGAIIDAIKEKGLTTVAEIKGVTGASRSCGGCKPLVAQILEGVLGDSFNGSAAKETICDCTSLSRDEVVQAIKEKGLTTVKETMNVLEWKNSEGCTKCRPAINYYLNMVDPTARKDENSSKLVNERVHANIQKDGTYSVVPRMYGGVTSPKELRKIADIAEKYNVPLVKVTGGQRLDLLGVKKEDLPKMWAELDMPSGYAYGKTTRTVKTCVGNSFCRFGTQNSIEMGIQLEKKFERLPAPAKIKMAVSGCPRNCAESLIKDVGVVAIDGGWELFVGGNGGVHLRGGELLCKVRTSEEVIEWTGAFLQYYREDANYGERTSNWVERVGLVNIQKVLEDAEERVKLNARIDMAVASVNEPWNEILNDDTMKREYTQIAAKLEKGEVTN